MPSGKHRDSDTFWEEAGVGLSTSSRPLSIPEHRTSPSRPSHVSLRSDPTLQSLARISTGLSALFNTAGGSKCTLPQRSLRNLDLYKVFISWRDIPVEEPLQQLFREFEEYVLQFAEFVDSMVKEQQQRHTFRVIRTTIRNELELRDFEVSKRLLRLHELIQKSNHGKMMSRLEGIARDYCPEPSP
eukprot:TRINITY_DN5568_c0_g1_i2.p1 TRINITY_DN5568_c0_g1~~TRINITY_DN5568_c0_g1_i2.p1  ORF type:complete len:186 (+),score=32.38 TRINITY_DN5568_c0_g1_i2:310-867(+)